MRLLVISLGAAALAVAPPAFGWSWPVSGPVLRPFSVGSNPYAAGQHRGIDIGAASGTPVVAPATGQVSFAGTVPRGGKTVTIQTPDGYSATLLHLGSYSVRRGEPVSEGSVVGTVGPSGVPELAQPYVYFGVRVTAQPNGYLDPLLLLPRTEPAPIGPPATGDDPPPQAPPASGGSPVPPQPASVPAPPAPPEPQRSAPPAETEQPAAVRAGVPVPARGRVGVVPAAEDSAPPRATARLASARRARG